MPTYEYRCDKCGFEFEREQRITEKPIRTCPKCKAQKARRLISATSFVLKGGGWYKDLYSSAGGSKKSEGGETGGSAPEAKAESRSEAKSDAKSEPKAKSGKAGKKAASA
jgi:putative FmdB family regulatory protein